MKRKNKARHFTVLTRVYSRTGKAPSVRVLCGDTLLINLSEGMTANSVLRHVKFKGVKA